MVKHVLMIKLKDNAQAECEKLRDLFLTMKGRVPQVIDVEAGADFSAFGPLVRRLPVCDA